MTSRVLSLAMILCDTVIQDAVTQKKSLIGCFNRIRATSLPLRHPKICIFLVLTEGHGTAACELRFLQTNTGKVLFQTSGKILFDNPNHVVEMVFDLSNLVFPEVGQYRFDFLCDGELVVSRKFEVEVAEGSDGCNRNAKE